MPGADYPIRGIKAVLGLTANGTAEAIDCPGAVDAKPSRHLEYNGPPNLQPRAIGSHEKMFPILNQWYPY